MQTDIKNIHDEIIQHAEALLTCLNSEFEILNSHEYENLIPIASQKQELVQSLNILDNKRQALTVDNDYSGYLEKIDASGLLLKHWNLTLEKIKQCNLQNEINGRLINKLNQISRETLDIFTGHNSSADVTYNPQGLKQGNSTQLTNTRA